MPFLASLFRHRTDPRDAMRPLWNAIIAIARTPDWYRDGGVADTLEGRFDMVTAVLAVTILRMETSPDLAVRTAPLTEIFVEEMDGQLRQTGVGDLMVGRQIGKLMATLGGRIGALRAALAVGGGELEQAVHRNVTLADASGAPVVAARLRDLARRLAETGDETLMQGELT